MTPVEKACYFSDEQFTYSEPEKAENATEGALNDLKVNSNEDLEKLVK